MNKPYKYSHSASWFLIFHHNSTGGYFDETNWLWFNTEHRYSALGTLEKYRINGKLEFLLEYPQFEGFNRFKQTSNQKVSKTIEGYKPIHLSWTTNSFGGLALSDYKGAFIDGSPGNLNGWFYAIAARNSWNGNIPGPYEKDQGFYQTTEVNLWIRVPLLCTNILYKRYNNHLISISLLIIGLLYKN